MEDFRAVRSTVPSLDVFPVLTASPDWYTNGACAQVPDDQHSIEVRVAVVGSVDAGKSTLLGVLTQGQLDNGRGRARLNMFRHLHEVQSGRTSSISHEILGFDSRVSDPTD